MTGFRGSFDALHEREFRLLFTGQLISLLGDSFTSVALSFAVLDLTHSATDLGIVLTARAVPLVLFLLVGGVFADRLPRRTMMLGADVVRMTCQASLAALILTHHALVWELAAIVAVHGSATAFFNPASTGLTPLTVSADRLQQANSLRGMSQSGAGLVGLALGGTVVTLAGPGWALAGDALSYGGSALFLSLLRLPPHVKLPPQSFFADLRDGWREFVSRTWLWVGVAAASLANLTTGIFSVLGPVVSKQSLGGPVAWTEILGGMSVGALLGGFAALHVHARRPFLLALSLISMLGLPMALLALRAPALLVATGALLGGGCNMLANTVWETTLQHLVPRAVLSRVTAYDWFGSMACQPIGLAIAGPLAVAIGTGTTLWLTAAAIVLIAAAAVSTPSVRRLEI